MGRPRGAESRRLIDEQATTNIRAIIGTIVTTGSHENRGARAQMIALAALVSTGPFATNAYLPALPAARATFDASLAQAQFTVAFPMLVFAIALVVCGPASDRFGRRRVLLVGLACFIIGSAMAFAASSLTMLAFGRAVQLVGGAAGLIVTRAIVSDTYAGARAARVITALGMVSLLGHAIAPPLAGYVVLHGGWRPIFAGLCVLGALLALVVLRTLPDSRSIRPGVGVDSRNGGLRALLSSRFVTGTLTVALLYASFSAFAALAPHIMLHAYGGDAAEYGRYYIIVPVGFIAGGLLLLKLKHVAAEHAVATGFLVLTVAPVIGVGLALSGMAHPLTFFLPMAGVCFGHALVIPTVSVRAVAQVAERVGTAWGVLTFTQHFTAALVVQLTSGLQTSSPVPVLGICAVVGACMGVLHWMNSRSGISPPPALSP